MNNYGDGDNVTIEQLAIEQYLSFTLAQGYIGRWSSISPKEREGWLAVARWTYQHVWSAETVVYFPDRSIE